jgi:Bacterial SH3 domain
MGQLKLIASANVLPLRVGRAFRGKQWQSETKENDRAPDATQPPLPLTPERLELIKAYGKPSTRNAEQRLTTPGSRQAEQGVPRARNHLLAGTPLATLGFALSSGRGLLVTSALIFVAVLQIFTLAAIFSMRWSMRVTMNEKANLEVQSTISAPVLSAPTTIKASAGENIPFPMALDGTDAVPARSIISISGLPQGSRFSSGRPYGEREWNFKPDEIGDVHLTMADAVGGNAQLSIQLVAPTGGILATATTLLNMTAEPAPNIPVHVVKTQLIQGEHWDQSSQEPMQGMQGRAGNLDPAKASLLEDEDNVPMPTNRPAMTTGAEVDASWIRPSASVNLRKGPKSSASVVGVIAKGAKLRVISRRRGWVEVTNPQTSQKGWIYAGIMR